MSLCVTVLPTGEVVEAQQQETPRDCYAVLLSGAEFGALTNPDFEALGITPEAITVVFLWGFGSVISCWVLGLAGSWVTGAIKRV